MKLHSIPSPLNYILVMYALHFCLLNWISDWFSAPLFVTNGMCAWYICCKANFERALLQLVAFISQFQFYGDFEVEALVYALRFLLCKGWKEFVSLSLCFFCFQCQSVQENNQIIFSVLVSLYAWHEWISLVYFLFFHKI